MAEIDAEEWLETELEKPQECIEQFRDRRRSGAPRADILNFAQKLPDTAAKYAYPSEMDSIAAVQITTFDEWWTGLPQESRKNVRKAEKRGVVVSVKELNDDLVKDIIDVNNDSPLRQGRTFDHYGKNFDQVKKDQSSFPGRSDFICAYVGEELVGFIKLVYSGTVASIVQIFPKASHADKKPANALIAKAVEVCHSKGMTHLVYGQYNYNNKGDSSLRQFKVRNGFNEILVPRFFVPLTLWGQICMKMKNLHHGFRGALTPRILALLVKARARWYAKFTFRRCSSTLEQSNRNRQMERSIPPAGSNIPDPGMSSPD